MNDATRMMTLLEACARFCEEPFMFPMFTAWAASQSLAQDVTVFELHETITAHRKAAGAVSLLVQMLDLEES